MKLALIGYGKMGKTIEQLAESRGHEVCARLSSSASKSEWESIKEADMAIEFTRPEAALPNFKRCLDLGVALVTGTTGWYSKMSEVESMVKSSEGAFFWASNFSIGVNLFWKLNEQLTALMNVHQEYEPLMVEIHHIQKLDEPSGTAITTANQMIAGLDRFTNWKLSTENPTETDIVIQASREGDVKGTHIVKYESDMDVIELKHEAKSRDGFALGSILAAEFLYGKRGVFTMKDLIK